MHQETLKDLRYLQLEQEKLVKKVRGTTCVPLHVVSGLFHGWQDVVLQVELLTRELWTAKNEKEQHQRSVDAQLQDAHQRLQGYEKIEKELDDIVMESAKSE